MHVIIHLLHPDYVCHHSGIFGDGNRRRYILKNALFRNQIGDAWFESYFHIYGIGAVDGYAHMVGFPGRYMPSSFVAAAALVMGRRERGTP